MFFDEQIMFFDVHWASGNALVARVCGRPYTYSKQVKVFSLADRLL